MMNTNLYTGDLVRLAAAEIEKNSEAFVRWNQDSEYWRMLTSDPGRLYSLRTTREWIEKEEAESSNYIFMIHTLKDDRLIGDIGLGGVDLIHGESYVGIGIGDREYWGKGYGSDAMKVLLRFAFLELNLHRVTLNVFEYNPRAIRSYEKAGFTAEGRVRDFLRREGRYWYLLHMGILLSEWERNNKQEVEQ